MGRALSIVERTRKTIFLIARFANIPESPSFNYGEYVNVHDWDVCLKVSICYSFLSARKTARHNIIINQEIILFILYCAETAPYSLTNILLQLTYYLYHALICCNEINYR